MKNLKYLKLLALPFLVFFLAGCDQTPTPSKLEGVWKCYDASHLNLVGVQYTFFLDGRCIWEDSLGWEKKLVRYDTQNKHLNIYTIDKNGEKELNSSPEISIKGKILKIEEPSGKYARWMKFKKIDTV
jgi:hypothetical protein